MGGAAAPTPRVTVVMPCFNARDHIGASIASVQAQTLPDWELLIVDDCSTDGSLAHIRHLAADDPRIKVIALDQNQGAAVARNTAIRAARGRFIAFLDADDQWFPDKLARQLDLMAHEGHAFVFSGYERYDEAGAFLNTVTVPSRVSYHQLLRNQVIGCLTAIYDRDALGTVEMPLIRKRQDFGLWLRLLRKTPYAVGIQAPLARYLVRSESVSSNKLEAARCTWRLYRDIEGFSVPRAAWSFVQYAGHAAWRTWVLPRLSKPAR